MSFILDALRKSERARRALGTLPADVPLDARLRRQRHAWFAVVAALLIVNAGLLAYFLWNGDAAAPVTETAVDASAAPSVAPEPAASRLPDRDVRPLATEAGVDPESPDALASASALSVSTPASTPAVTTPVSALPVLAALPPSLAGRLPPLHVDVHSYSDDPKKRFALVNLKRYAEGERLAEGPLVVEIVPEGLVLEFEGARFLLPRG